MQRTYQDTKMRNRKKTKVKLLLEVLSDGQWHLGDELATKVGHRFGDAVDKARDKQNQPIETDRVGVGQKHKYRLLNV